MQSLYAKLSKDGSIGRLGKVFQTDRNYYFYDTGTGKVAKLKYNVYLVLKALLESHDCTDLMDLPMSETDFSGALIEIMEAIQKESILSAVPITTMKSEAVDMLDEILQHGIRNVTLEITEKCNLRCKYCIYHPDHPEFREFGHCDMTWEVAQKAIDFFIKHSKKDKSRYIGFYGGEPLLNYKLIKKVVEYAEERLEDVTFAITTNATLITDEIAEFFLDHNFNIIISLDGPRELHDANRIMQNGDGSFDKTIEGVKKVIREYKKNNKTNKIGFNMVTTRENMMSRFNMIQKFLDNEKWIPKDIMILTSGEDKGPSESKYIVPQSTEDREFMKNVYEPLVEWEKSYKKQMSDKEKSLFSDGAMDKGMTIIHKRHLTDKPVLNYGMNGCCIPGQRRLFVTVDGTFLHCEKIGDIPNIGNIYDGFNIERIKKLYIDDFISEAVKYCKDCWAINICTLCYVNCYDQNGVHFAYRHNSCRSERKYIENNLVRYHSIMEDNPKALDHYNDVIID